jgi:uncharacterized RDD family membrane protein YckC/predicted Ser/Thr protein kinase
LKPANPDRNHFCQTCGSELLLVGRYQVMRLLSDKGGFGKTYEVMDGNTPKVLKVLTEDRGKAVELFAQEARVLTQLKHPGIPKGEGSFIYHTRDGQTSLHCLVMEKVEGKDLEEYQKENQFKPIAPELALEWLSQLAFILHEVHRHKFFHRDIKPSNIILKPDGNLSLIDFGAARQVTGTIMAGEQSTGIYTPGYAPPEQQRGYAVPQSDFYALGRTFVYLLAGKEPNDPAIYDFQNNQLNWRKYAPHVGAKLADLIDKLMDERPANRPGDTKEILKEIIQIKKSLLKTEAKSKSPAQTASQKQTVRQPPSQPPSKVPPQPKPTTAPIIHGHHAGFWIRFKAAIVDDITVMALAASLAGLIVYKLAESGQLYNWGIEGYDSTDLIIKAALVSGIGTTVFGFIFSILGLALLAVSPDSILSLLPADLDWEILRDILWLIEGNLLLLIPLTFGAWIKWLYFTFSETIFKATLGKIIWRIQVNNLKGGRISFLQANSRYWGKLLSLIPFCAGFMLAGWTKNKRGLHDFIAGTIVVKKDFN